MCFPVITCSVLLHFWRETSAWPSLKIMLLRARATSFLAGVALAGAVAYFQLRQDLLQSQQVLIDQVRLLIEVSPAGAALGVRLDSAWSSGLRTLSQPCMRARELARLRFVPPFWRAPATAGASCSVFRWPCCCKGAALHWLNHFTSESNGCSRRSVDQGWPLLDWRTYQLLL